MKTRTSGFRYTCRKVEEKKEDALSSKGANKKIVSSLRLKDRSAGVAIGKLIGLSEKTTPHVHIPHSDHSCLFFNDIILEIQTSRDWCGMEMPGPTHVAEHSRFGGYFF